MTRSNEMTMLTATPTSTLHPIVNVKVRNMSPMSIHARILGANEGSTMPSGSRRNGLTSNNIPELLEPQLVD